MLTLVVKVFNLSYPSKTFGMYIMSYTVNYRLKNINAYVVYE